MSTPEIADGFNIGCVISRPAVRSYSRLRLAGESIGVAATAPSTLLGGRERGEGENEMRNENEEETGAKATHYMSTALRKAEMIRSKL